MHEPVPPEQVPCADPVQVRDPPQFAAVVQLGFVHVPSTPPVHVKAEPREVQSAVLMQVLEPPEHVPALGLLQVRPIVPQSDAALQRLAVHAPSTLFLHE